MRASRHVGGLFRGLEVAQPHSFRRSFLLIGCILLGILLFLLVLLTAGLYCSYAFRQFTIRHILTGASQRQSIRAIESVPGVEVWFSNSRRFGWACRSASVDDQQLADLEPELRALRVKYLYLSESPITDAGAESLGRLDTLRSLDLRWTQIGDVGVTYIADIRSLQDLNLAGTRVTDVCLVKLKQLKCLEHLDISDTHVTDAGLTPLQQLQHLKVLYVGGTQVTNSGVTQLETALPAVHVDAIKRPKGR